MPISQQSKRIKRFKYNFWEIGISHQFSCGRNITFLAEMK